MEFVKENLVKSPLNYTGGKFKLLPQILPLFPNKISMLYDVFGGGGSVSFNVNANHVYYNDIVNYVGDMFKSLQNENVESAKFKLNALVDKYKLSKTNLDGFLKLREDYNGGNKSWDMFYILVCYSFNSQYRFNNNQEYNSSFGKHKSHYSDATELKLEKFIKRLHDTDVVFDSKDFRDVNYSDVDKNDLVYLDPPYLISKANYNDGKRGFKGWSDECEKDLLKLCDELNKTTRFALSNILEDKGKSNDILKEWSKKYNVHYLNNTYGNCNYQAKDKSKTGTIEVLITNY